LGKKKKKKKKGERTIEGPKGTRTDASLRFLPYLYYLGARKREKKKEKKADAKASQLSKKKKRGKISISSPAAFSAARDRLEQKAEEEKEKKGGTMQGKKGKEKGSNQRRQRLAAGEGRGRKKKRKREEGYPGGCLRKKKGGKSDRPVPSPAAKPRPGKGKKKKRERRRDARWLCGNKKEKREKGGGKHACAPRSSFSTSFFSDNTAKGKERKKKGTRPRHEDPRRGKRGGKISLPLHRRGKGAGKKKREKKSNGLATTPREGREEGKKKKLPRAHPLFSAPSPPHEKVKRGKKEKKGSVEISGKKRRRESTVAFSISLIQEKGKEEKKKKGKTSDEIS